MTEAVRISPDEARVKARSGEAFLVCAYEDENKFRKMHLEDAISLGEFRKREEYLSKGQEVIFY